MFEVRSIRPEDVAVIVQADGGPWWRRDERYWLDCIEQQIRGRIVSVVAMEDGDAIGYASLKWHSAYPPFRERGVAEIADLRVAEGHRRHGVATAIISYLEGIAATASCRTIGIGVGLYADYGGAQCLYVKLGFSPDGRGISYNEVAVPPGEMVRVDDSLILWLVKALPLGS